MDEGDHDGIISTLLDAAVAHFLGPGNKLGIDPDTVTEIAPPIRAAILLKVRALYDQDERATAVNERSIKALTDPLRRRWVG